MAAMYLQMLDSFGFDEMQVWIASISALLFTSNFLGGVLSALMFVVSRKLEQRPLKERISFRLFGLTELVLLVFIFFYHVFMIETITPEHMIYWASAMMMIPLMAIIGSQVILVTFSSKIEAKNNKLEQQKIKQRKAVREQRRRGMDDGPPPGSRQPRQAQKSSSNPLKQSQKNPLRR